MFAMSSLYLNHFGLHSPPFAITPDPDFFFEGSDRGAFLDGLLHAALQAEGIVLVVGEVGSGKTLMSRILLTRLPAHVDTVYLPNPAFSHDEIIDVIARDLGIATTLPGMRMEALQRELIQRHARGRQVVVLIDEAHTMPVESIEEVRRLSNLETSQHKLVQLILCGQPELDTLLAAPELRQVRDRVVYRLALQNLSSADAGSYLDHRLRIAGWRGGQLFSWPAMWLLLNDAQGRVRRINLIADKSMLAAFAEGHRQVSTRHVHLAIQDAGANFSSVRIPRWSLATTLLILTIASFWLLK
jgi:type II secretory pathway predicted ATPase ExeA